MVFDDAEVEPDEGAVGADLYLRLIAVEGEGELLLIHRGGREQGGFDPRFEPVRHLLDVGHILNAFGAAGMTVIDAVADGDREHELFILRDRGGDLLALEDACPTGVQTELLRVQDELFADITAALVEIIAAFADHRDVGGHVAPAGELGRQSAEYRARGFDILHMQVVLFVQLRDAVFEQFCRIGIDGFLLVSAYRVARVKSL